MLLNVCPSDCGLLARTGQLERRSRERLAVAPCIQSAHVPKDNGDSQHSTAAKLVHAKVSAAFFPASSCQEEVLPLCRADSSMESPWHCLGCAGPLTSLPMRGLGVLRPCRLTHIHSNPLRKLGAGWGRTPGVHRCHSSLSNITVTESPATSHASQHPDTPSASPAPSRSGAYPFTEIEQKWQQHWQQHETFRTPDISELDTSKPKFYALDMFPYPR